MTSGRLSSEEITSPVIKQSRELDCPGGYLFFRIASDMPQGESLEITWPSRLAAVKNFLMRAFSYLVWCFPKRAPHEPTSAPEAVR